MASERERIARLKQLLERPHPDVVLGIGDDAAVLATDEGRLVLSVDTVVEGVHFTRAVASLVDVGYRATAAALSDLAAMGASPRAVLSALILPESLDDDGLDALARGVAQACDAHGTLVVGGNLSRGSELSLTTTVVGRAGARLLTRDAARPGDLLCVSGSVGAAAAGLAWLAAGRQAGEAPHSVTAFHRPAARLELGQSLAEAGASAAVDVSDGLLSDLDRLCEASTVGAVVECARLPIAEETRRVADELGLSADALALSGGDDYELLYTAPPGSGAVELGTRIGRIQHGTGVQLLGADGEPMAPPDARGFGHFG